MNNLDMESVDIVDKNIEKIGELFPDTIVESEKGKSIDFNLLKQELSKAVVDDSKEKYQLTWPGKKESIINANTPSTNTLRPLKDKSVDFDNTQNIYIEGDNLEALKILQESYLNKIKCIYIDPPYNTGNDFIYNDSFDKDANKELEESGQIDDEGKRLVTNNQSNGRFHSDWLSMMYPRLKLARNLLSKDGFMFISIDDNEQYNLKSICLSIFGEGNVDELVWQKQGNDNKSIFSGVNTIRNDHENILIVYKNKRDTQLNRPSEITNFKNTYGNADNDPRGNWMSAELGKSDKNSIPTGKNYFTLTSPTGKSWTRQWHYSQEEIVLLEKNNKIYWGNGETVPRLKKFLSEPVKKIPSSLLLDKGSTKVGKQDIIDLFGEEIFNYPKPIVLLKYLLSLQEENNCIVMDFFSGSGGTAQACLELNAEDKGNRRFIMCQLPEQCSRNNSVSGNHFKNVCEIGEERIRRASKKIKEETNADIDYGFRVFKIDSSNMKDVYYKPNDVDQSQLKLFESNIKDDRTNEDLLTQVILDLGLPLDLKVEEKNIKNNKVYFVDNNSLVACFDNQIDISIVDEIAKCNPLKVVFKDESFKYDNDKINLMEKFKKLSPDTEISIL